MKHLKLNKEFTEFLSRSPETGMGYQVVDVILKNGKVYSGMVVLNSTYLVMDDPAAFTVNDIDQIEIKQ